MTGRIEAPARSPRPSAWPAVVAWAVAAIGVTALDGHVSVMQQALLVVLAAAIAGSWLPVGAAVATSMIAVLAFDVAFVPPRGSFVISDPAQAALVVTLCLVAGLVGALTARQRALAAEARREAWRADRLRDLGEALRASEDPAERASVLAEALRGATGAEVTLVMAAGALPPRRDDAALRWLGDADEDQRVGLWVCLRHAHALGPGSGRHEEVADWYVPMRGRGAAYGAALLKSPVPDDALPLARADAQALCDGMGLALERAVAWRAAAQAHESARAHAMSNAFLAAISHDYRTPLAAILGAASSLLDQDARLPGPHRRRLAERIVDEARELDRMTTNTLQLARLDAPGMRLQLDWESAEEIVGTARRHARQRPVGEEGTAPPEVHARVEPGLPLLRCDALLLVQLLDNLVDNACKHAPGTPIEIVACRDARGGEDAVVLAVRDRGPGIPPVLRERVFEVFQRGAPPPGEAPRRGSGVGLAVCRAIAQVHGGTLDLRPREGGGCSFECRLPVGATPADRPPDDVPSVRGELDDGDER
jgi:two-component system sensor histidine kinase KdpD